MPKPKRKPEETEPQHTTTLRLPERVWRRVRGQAGNEGKSANEWIAEQLEKLTGGEAQQEQQRVALA